MEKSTDNAKAMTINRGLKARRSLSNNTKNRLAFTHQNKPEKKKYYKYTNPIRALSNHL